MCWSSISCTRAVAPDGPLYKAEGIPITVSEIAPKALADERDYDVMSEFTLLSATLALVT